VTSAPPASDAGERVRAVTDLGDIVIALDLLRAPKSGSAFLAYVEQGRYTGGAFVRTVRRDNDQGTPLIEVIQAVAGGPSPDDGAVEHEPTSRTFLTHTDGAVSLPRPAAGSATVAAFFICIGDQPALDAGEERHEDGLGFAAFGRVVEGMEVVRAIHAAATCEDAPDPYLLGQMIEEPVAIHAIRREPTSAVDQFSELAEDYWAFRVREFPLEASEAGVRSANRQLDRASEADHARRALLCSALLKRALAIDPTALQGERLVSLELLRGQLERLLEAHDLNDHLQPVVFPFGYFDVPDQLVRTTAFNSLEDLEDFGARMERLDLFLREHHEAFLTGLEAGYPLSRILQPRIVALIDAHIAPSGLAAQLHARLDAAVPEPGEAVVMALKERITQIFVQVVLPRLEMIRDAYRDLPPEHLTDSASCCDRPGGEDYYRFRIRQQTSTDLDADQIHAIGLEEVAVLEGELANVLLRLGDTDARAAAARLGGRLAADADGLLAHLRATAKRIDGLLPRLFGMMPRITYAVEQMTPEQSRELPPALAQPAPADRTRPGVYLATALPERCPLYLAVPLTLHEAWPGHLMQFAIAHELDRLPAFRRYGWTDYNGYIEGWALYCERLGHDLGLYDDAESHFGRLTFDLWRAARLVVDTGLHWKRWSRGEAIAYLAEHTFLPNDVIAAEVDRYVGLPAQALSYKLGERAIRMLRAEAKETLKAAFSLREFHDELLAVGPVSLSALEGHMRRWMSLRNARSAA
jgi:uncharacterized protein (DUF885 family)